MEPKFQSSFIPKSPIISGGEKALSVVHSGNIFSTLATTLFVITVLASLGLFAYSYSLKNQISQNDKSLLAAREAFQAEKIQELLTVNGRIVAAKTLLGKHIAVSELLTFLQSGTVKNARFESLSYKQGTKGQTLSLGIEAASYNAVAAEKEALSGTLFLQNQVFSDFTLSDNGTVKAKFFANVNASLLLYKKTLSE